MFWGMVAFTEKIITAAARKTAVEKTCRESLFEKSPVRKKPAKKTSPGRTNGKLRGDRVSPKMK